MLGMKDGFVEERGDVVVVEVIDDPPAGPLAATVHVDRRRIGGLSLAQALLAFPFMTLKVIASIHWQALRLWLKRVPVYTHPKKLPSLNQGGAHEAKPQ